MTNWGHNPQPWDFKRNLKELASAALWQGPDKTGNRISRANVRHLIIMNLVILGAYEIGYHGGRWLRHIDDLPNGEERPLDYRTPVMFGNNDRGQLFPWKAKPYPLDFEKCLEFHRLHDLQYTETILLYQTMRYHSFFHPGREDKDDSLITTAEHHADVLKRLNE